MSKRKKKRKIGLPPGSMIYTGEMQAEEAFVNIMLYNADKLVEKKFTNKDFLASQFSSYTDINDKNSVIWYDVRGLHDVAVIEQIGSLFQVHPLALEDVLNTQQRPKWEDYQNGIFLVARYLHYNSTLKVIATEQIAFYLGQNYLLTFQEHSDDTFCNVRDRLEKSIGKIRMKGADYLTYTILDYIVDNFFVILDKTEEEIETLEQQILINFQPKSRNEIYQLKRQLSEIRRAVLPLREVVGRFVHDAGNFLDISNTIYVRDLQDHISQIVEIVDNQRDMITNLDDLYNIEQTSRTNHVMRVLTIVSSIFIPLTFIVGVYGMNFDNLPELHYHNAYYWVWIVMIIIAVLQLIYFKFKRWL